MKRKYITFTKKEDIILFNILKKKTGAISDTEFVRDLMKTKAEDMGIVSIELEIS